MRHREQHRVFRPQPRRGNLTRTGAGHPSHGTWRPARPQGLMGRARHGRSGGSIRQRFCGWPPAAAPGGLHRPLLLGCQEVGTELRDRAHGSCLSPRADGSRRRCLRKPLTPPTVPEPVTRGRVSRALRPRWPCHTPSSGHALLAPVLGGGDTLPARFKPREHRFPHQCASVCAHPGAARARGHSHAGGERGTRPPGTPAGASTDPCCSQGPLGPPRPLPQAPSCSRRSKCPLPARPARGSGDTEATVSRTALGEPRPHTLETRHRTHRRFRSRVGGRT